MGQIPLPVGYRPLCSVADMEVGVLPEFVYLSLDGDTVVLGLGLAPPPFSNCYVVSSSSGLTSPDYLWTLAASTPSPGGFDLHYVMPLTV